MDADLIVMATHGRSQLGAFWAGSVAPRVSSRVKKPLLLVPVREPGLYEEAANRQSIAQVLEAFNDAFNRHDVPAMMELMTEDCVFENTYPPPDGARYAGADGGRRLLAAVLRRFAAGRDRRRGDLCGWRPRGAAVDLSLDRCRGQAGSRARGGRLSFPRRARSPPNSPT